MQVGFIGVSGVVQMKGKVPATIPKEIYDEILTAQRELVEARGQLLETQTPEQLAHVLACLHRSAGHVERAMKACARASDRSDGQTDGSA